MTSTTAPRLVAKALLGAALIAVLLVPAGSEPAGSPTGPAWPPSVPGEIVVRYRPGTGESARGSVRTTAGASLTSRLPIAQTELIDVGTKNLTSAIEHISARPEVLYAEPNYIYEGAAVPNDASFGELWGMDNRGQEVLGLAGRPDADIDATDAWDRTTGNDSVLVAVVDSGVVADHPDLASNMWSNPGESGDDRNDGEDDDDNSFVDDWQGWDFVSDDNFPDDEHGHGTHVAGTIGARGDDGYGVAGVAWDVSLLSVRVLAADNTGTLADIAAGMDYAGRMGARVANVSIQSSAFSKLMRSAIADHPDTLYVIAAGNGGSDGASDDNDIMPTYPCAYPGANILCVAATDQNDRLTNFSNFGTRTVDLAAPGQDTFSSQPALASPFNDLFDEDLARWTTGGAKSTWALVDHLGGGRLEDSPGGPYANNTNSWVMTEPIDLSANRNCKASYDLDLAVRQGDRLIVEGTSDGIDFERVDEWFFRTHGWVYYVRDDLSAFNGEQEFQLRFRFRSDGAGTSRGAKIDNLFIECTGSEYTADSFTYLSGTSMAAPHAAGVAALAFAAVPGATVAAVKEAMLAGVDVRPGLVGSIKTGGRLNAERTLALLTQPPGPGSPEEVCVQDPLLAQPPSPVGEGSSGALTGDFTREILDDTAVFDEVDAAFGPAQGLHVVGATGDDEITYFDPSGAAFSIEDVDLTHSAVALGVASEDSPVIGYHDRLVADEDGSAQLCEANMISAGPDFVPQVVDVVDRLNGSFSSFDLAVDPVDGTIHRAFARGKNRRLFYVRDGEVEKLPLTRVDDVKIAAVDGEVVVGALSDSIVHVYLRGAGEEEEAVYADVRAWDLDIGADGDPRVAWTNHKGRLRFSDGTVITRLRWEATEVAIASAPVGKTMHVAIGTTFPYCKGFGCGKVAYVEKVLGADPFKQVLSGTPGYVTSVAIAASGIEIAIVYGDPSAGGHLVVQRALL